MRGLIGLLIAAVVAFGIYQFYVAPHGKSESMSSMMQAVSSTGVKNDLIAISQAERRYLAEHGTYAKLDELISSGALAATSRNREGYTYSVEITSSGFLAVARYTGPARPPGPSYSLDQAMQFRTVQ